MLTWKPGPTGGEASLLGSPLTFMEEPTLVCVWEELFFCPEGGRAKPETFELLYCLELTLDSESAAVLRLLLPARFTS